MYLACDEVCKDCKYYVKYYIIYKPALARDEKYYTITKSFCSALPEPPLSILTVKFCPYYIKRSVGEDS